MVAKAAAHNCEEAGLAAASGRRVRGVGGPLSDVEGLGGNLGETSRGPRLSS